MLIALVLVMVVCCGGVLDASSSWQRFSQRMGSPFRQTVATILISLTLLAGVHHVAAEDAKPGIKIIAPGFKEPEWEDTSSGRAVAQKGL